MKVAAEQSGAQVLQPGSLQDPETIDQLRELAPDVAIVVSYGEILQQELLDLPLHGCINIHPSLLPSYRGSIPIQAAILSGDHETGVTFIKLVRRMDAGPVISQVRYPLNGTETAGSLSTTLAELAAEQLPSVIRDWVNGNLQAQAQDEASATYTREMSKADAQIDWNWTAAYIERFVRAMSPWPRAWTTLGDQRLSIIQASVVESTNSNVETGVVRVDDDAALVETSHGRLLLESVQPAGKREMQARDWARGLQNEKAPKFDLVDEERPPLIFRR